MSQHCRYPGRDCKQRQLFYSGCENCILPCQDDMKDVQQNLLLHDTRNPVPSTCGNHKRKTIASKYLQLATSPRRLRSQDLHGSARSLTAVKKRTMERVWISSRGNLTTVTSLPWSMGTIPVAHIRTEQGMLFSNGSRLWTKRLVRIKHLKKNT
jgi:hypothetical protein